MSVIQLGCKDLGSASHQGLAGHLEKMVWGTNHWSAITTHLIWQRMLNSRDIEKAHKNMNQEIQKALESGLATTCHIPIHRLIVLTYIRIYIGMAVFIFLTGVWTSIWTSGLFGHLSGHLQQELRVALGLPVGTRA